MGTKKNRLKYQVLHNGVWLKDEFHFSDIHVRINATGSVQSELEGCRVNFNLSPWHFRGHPEKENSFSYYDEIDRR